MRVVITNASEDAGATAARSLAEAGYEVYGIDTRRLPRSAASRYLSQYEYLSEGDEVRRQDGIRHYIQRSRADIFLPLGTRGVLSAIRHRKVIEVACAINVVGADAFRAAYDKQRCVRECGKLGIACAETYSLADALSVLRSDKDRTLVVKPSFDVGAARDVTYVKDADKLNQAARVCEDRYGRYLIQDFIPGNAERMKTAVMLFSRNGELAAAFTSQKTRHWPTTGGPTACSHSTDERGLLDMVLPFFRKFAWCGPAEVEFKLDPRDNCHKVIEINPRFPGYLRFPWHCGLDLPLYAVQIALGTFKAEMSLPTYRVGATYVAPTLFFSSVREEARTRGWRAALRGARSDLRGSAALLKSMLADPIPPIARVMSPMPTLAELPDAALEGLEVANLQATGLSLEK